VGQGDNYVLLQQVSRFLLKARPSAPVPHAPRSPPTRRQEFQQQLAAGAGFSGALAFMSATDTAADATAPVGSFAFQRHIFALRCVLSPPLAAAQESDGA
jgi:hypothetical protein